MMQALHPANRLSTPADSKMNVLRRLLEALMWEFRAVRESRWEDLPELYVRKKELVDHLADFDWSPGPGDRDNLELLSTKAQIIDLDFQIRKVLDTHLAVLRSQLDDLKRRHMRWRTAATPYRPVVT